MTRVRSFLVFSALLVPGAAAPVHAQSFDEAEFEAFVEDIMDTWHVPGMAIAVVKDSAVVYANGFGVRDMESEWRVTPETHFAIGSSSKAFTTMVLGMLDEAGTIDWDEPVRSWLPDFEMWDDFASERMTPRDLVTHRSGLPRHDLLWYGSNETRAELYSRLRHLEPTQDFRTTFQYQNLMYMTAGYLAGQVTGSTWEQLVDERVFGPLGMETATFDWETAWDSGDAARGYRWDEDTEEHVLMPYYDLQGAIGPAGSIIANVEEMANWVILHLNGGSFGGEQVVAQGQIRDMHAQSMFVPRTEPDPETPLFGYGLGWFTEPYRGHRRVHHGGNIDGFSALVSMALDDGVGVVILSNLNGNPATGMVERGIMDRMLGLEPIDWSQRALDQRAEAEAAAEENPSEDEEEDRVEGTTMDHALEEYAATYENDGYGPTEVTFEDGGLVARYNAFVMDLEHWHYEQFKGVVRDRPGAEFMLVFGTDQSGAVASVSAELQAGVETIVFDRKAPDQMTDPDFLQQFTGVYELGAREVTVELRGTVLHVTVPGQPTYEMEPIDGTTFHPKGLPESFRMSFVIEDEVVTAMRSHQPNGTFTAKKVR